jgi:predicted nucleotidyltransferase component of viral defense system
MNTLFEQMLSAYDLSSTAARRNATFEVMQQLALAGLHRGAFFDKAAFYGGTCLRIFHHLKRFSEDMDFTLLQPEDDFSIENYFQAIVDEFKSAGKEVILTRKEKKHFGKVESAFLKEDTHVYDLTFQTERSVKVKIEVDIHPPLGFQTEQRFVLRPYSFGVRCVTLPDLYAGKMHALTFRTWGSRVKGRDWFDFEWYVQNNLPLDFEHLRQRAMDFNGIDLTREHFLALLQERLTHTDIELVKRDVLPFIKDPSVLAIWSNEYFLRLAQNIRFA